MQFQHHWPKIFQIFFGFCAHMNRTEQMFVYTFFLLNAENVVLYTVPTTPLYFSRSHDVRSFTLDMLNAIKHKHVYT